MRPMVTVEVASYGQGWQCTVVAGDGGQTTHHTVAVTPSDLERWGRPGEAPEQLVARAFEFLLAREPASQVLRRFDLADIQRYFPEFEREIRR